MRVLGQGWAGSLGCGVAVACWGPGQGSLGCPVGGADVGWVQYPAAMDSKDASFSVVVKGGCGGNRAGLWGKLRFLNALVD